MFLLPVCTWCYSPKSDYVSIGGTVSGMPENCVVAAYIRFLSVLFFSRHQLIITSGLRPPYWIYKCRKCTTWLMWVRLKKIANENHITGISSVAGTKPEIQLGGTFTHPPPLATYVIKNTLAIGGLTWTPWLLIYLYSWCLRRTYDFWTVHYCNYLAPFPR